MGKIDITDTIFITIQQYGKKDIYIQFKGITSWKDAVKKISNIYKIKGLATLLFRNGTQGWFQKRQIMFARPHTPMQLTMF